MEAFSLFKGDWDKILDCDVIKTMMTRKSNPKTASQIKEHYNYKANQKNKKVAGNRPKRARDQSLTALDSENEDEEVEDNEIPPESPKSLTETEKLIDNADKESVSPSVNSQEIANVKDPKDMNSL